MSVFRRHIRKSEDEVAKEFILKQCDQDGFKVVVLKEKGILM